jgi:hypothetical protein
MTVARLNFPVMIDADAGKTFADVNLCYYLMVKSRKEAAVYGGSQDEPALPGRPMLIVRLNG